MNIGKSIEFINMKFLVDDSLGLGFLKMSLVLVYHKNCCLGCIVIGGRFFGGTPYFAAVDARIGSIPQKIVYKYNCRRVIEIKNIQETILYF